MRNDPWLALFVVGLFVLIAGPLAFNADPSDARIAWFAMTPPALLAGLVWLQRARPDSNRRQLA